MSRLARSRHHDDGRIGAGGDHRRGWVHDGRLRGLEQVCRGPVAARSDPHLVSGGLHRAQLVLGESVQHGHASHPIELARMVSHAGRSRICVLAHFRVARAVNVAAARVKLKRDKGVSLCRH